MRTTSLALLLIFSSLHASAATRVTIHTDDTRAVHAVIQTSGGTLTATAADGTVFTLTIPPNALLSSETITMTPIAMIEKLPMSGGLIAAVQLEPSGLRLFEAATLVLKTPRPIPLGTESPVAWKKNGNDFHNYPLQIDPNTITFKLLHFSGAGVASGTEADRANQRASIPCDKEAAMQQEAAAVIGPERERQKAGLPEDPTFGARLMDVYFNYFTNTIQPMMNSARNSKDDGVLLAAWSRVLGFMRTIEVTTEFFPDPRIAATNAAMFDFLSNVAQTLSNNALDHCVNERKPEFLQRILGAERMVQVVGLPIDLNTQEKIDKCGRFELIFESQFDKVADPGGGIRITQRMHATVTVPIRFTMDIAPLVGSAPLDYVYSMTYAAPSPMSCTMSNATGTAGSLVVLKMETNLNVKEPDDPCSKRRAASHAIESNASAPPPPFELISMKIDVSTTSESATAKCCVLASCSSSTMTFDGEFSGSWRDLHEAENKGGNSYEIRDWGKATGGALLARKTYVQSVTHGIATWNEVTTLDFFHRP